MTSNKGLQLLENHLQSRQLKAEKEAIDTLDDLELEMAKLKLQSTNSEEMNEDTNKDLNSNHSELGVLGLLKSNIHENVDFKNNPSSLDNSYIWNRPREANLNNSSLIRSGSESSLDSFLSAHSDLSEQSSVFSAEEGIWIYLEGDKPCQTDEQVYQIIKDCDIDSMKYPAVHTWKCLMESYLPTDRNNWSKIKSTTPRKAFQIPTFSYD